MKPTLGPIEVTSRGFELILFKDQNATACSLQQSSLVEPSIWLGLHECDPKVMAREAADAGVKTDKTEGWVSYPIPAQVYIPMRMHLNQQQVSALVEHLQHWLRQGNFQE